MTPDDQTQAAELALGLLDGADRAAALERMLADHGFAMEVAWWQEKFAALLDRYEPVTPPADLLERIVLPDDQAASPPVLVRRRWPWFAGGATAGAIAASLVALLALPQTPPPAPATPPPVPPLVAVLVPGGDAQQAPLAALIDRRRGVVRLTATIVVPADRVAELWRIGSDKMPRPLGLLSRGAVTPTLLQGARLPAQDEVLAVSIEPQGGSPTGKPTGPVIATGALVDMT